MKKQFLLFVAMFAFFLFGCQKETELSQIQSENNANNYPTKHVGGEIIKGDGWIGWIDPELVGGDKVEGEIIQGEANLKAEWLEIEGTLVSLACTNEGDNCGLLYEVNENGVRPVGYYSCE